MSTSDLYILNGKSVMHLAEFRNGWGSAPRCWDHLAKKYLGMDSPLIFSDMKSVWNLANGDRLSNHEKIALMLTFDYSYIPLKNLPEAADACKKFGVECENGDAVNHWPAFGDAILKASTMKHNRHARGVCLSCTSVSDIWIDITSDQASKAWPIFDQTSPLPTQ